MKKGAGIAITALVVGVIALLTFGVLYLIVGQSASVAENASERSKIEIWVNAHAKGETGLLSTTYPETDTLYKDPIKILEESQFKVDSKTGVSPAAELIVNAMYECWTAFGSGNIDFLKYSEKKLGTKPFCFSCAQVVFSDKFKEAAATKPYVIQDYGYYLTNGHPPTSSKSFAELIYNKKEREMEKEELVVTKDFRIMMIAERGSQGKAAGEINPWEWSFLGLGGPVLAYGIATIGTITEDNNVYAIVKLTDEEIKAKCTA